MRGCWAGPGVSEWEGRGQARGAHILLVGEGGAPQCPAGDPGIFLPFFRQLFEVDLRTVLGGQPRAAGSPRDTCHWVL